MVASFDLHIKRSDSAVGDTAAHSTSKGEAAVEGEALLGGILGSGDGSHCVCDERDGGRGEEIELKLFFGVVRERKEERI
jgi:hypothetical protein